MSDHIENSIKYMWDNCAQPISLDELAEVAKYSKFYFVRRFGAETRCSPIRFLSAVRLARGKRLLATTSTNVSDIAHAVGYHSYGTFTSRFTEAVGLSPSQYRRHTRGERVPLRWTEPGPGQPGTPVVTGRILDAAGDPVECAYVSVVAAANPMSSSGAALIVARRGDFAVHCLPAGKWIVRAIAVPAPGGDGPHPRTVRIGSEEFRLRCGERSRIEITLRERTIRTPPFLPALPVF